MQKKLFLLIAFFQISFLYVQGKQTADSADIDIILYQKIPTRDGIHLSCNIYKPGNQKGKLPAIVVYTPYVSDHNQERGMYFASHGYVFISVDIRGRGNSEGFFSGFDYCAEDGYDAIEWIAKQPFCDGRVAMMGGSWKGMSQWMTAKLSPPSLKTIVPTASVGPGIDFPNGKMFFSPYNVRWLSYVSGRTSNDKLFNDNAYWKSKFTKFFNENLPFENLAPLAGNNEWIFKKWIAHPTYDDYWKSLQPTEEQYRKIKIPILTITGYFDGDQAGAMNYYFNYMKYGSKKDSMYLIIGPYNHSETRRPKVESGGLKFAQNVVLDINNLHKQWFDYIFKNKPFPEFIKNKVCYYTLPDNQWKYAPSIDSIATKKVSYYLVNDQNKNCNNVYKSGSLSLNRGSNKRTDTIFYNPLQKKVERYGDDTLSSYITNNYTNTNSSLFYQTEAFDTTLSIFGYMQLNLSLQMTAKDADLAFEAYEVTPTGTSIYLTAGVMRARFKDGYEKESFPEQNKPFKLTIKSDELTQRTIQKGSRIRISVYHLNSIYLQKNYGSGKNISKESAKDAIINQILLLHDAVHFSNLEFFINEK
jgi:putative CocE/NonD family hydrolase